MCSSTAYRLNRSPRLCHSSGLCLVPVRHLGPVLHHCITSRSSAALHLAQVAIGAHRDYCFESPSQGSSCSHLASQEHPRAAPGTQHPCSLPILVGSHEGPGMLTPGERPMLPGYHPFTCTDDQETASPPPPRGQAPTTTRSRDRNSRTCDWSDEDTPPALEYFRPPDKSPWQVHWAQNTCAC